MTDSAAFVVDGREPPTLINTAGLSLSTVVAAPEAASQEAMRVAPVAKGLPVTASGAAFAMFLPLMFCDVCCV
jgi:hypothetical protein